jgi:hypothetical protein
MMNEEKQFEQRLSRQPMKGVPPDWRAEILSAAQGTEPRTRIVIPKKPAPTLREELTALFWPHPKAWAGLAAVWVGILALHLFTGAEAPRTVRISMQPSPQVLVQLREQRRMFAELAGNPEVREVIRPKAAPNRPHTQRVEIMVA